MLIFTLNELIEGKTQLRPQVTECGVEKEPARREHLKQEASLQLEDNGVSYAGSCWLLMALKTGGRLIY